VRHLERRLALVPLAVAGDVETGAIAHAHQRDAHRTPPGKRVPQRQG
jgi:hypothetical protein